MFESKVPVSVASAKKKLKSFAIGVAACRPQVIYFRILYLIHA